MIGRNHRLSAAEMTVHEYTEGNNFTDSAGILLPRGSKQFTKTGATGAPNPS